MKRTHTKKAFIDRSKANDGFANFTSRLGAIAQNNLSNGSYQFDLLTRNRLKLEAMYRGSWLTGNIVDCVAEDMTRAGIDIIHEGDPKEVETLTAGITRMGIWGDLADAIKWSRLYGGAIAVMMIDGQDASTPLDMDTVTKGQFKGLAVYDRWQLQPTLHDIISEGAEFGLPRFYKLISLQGENKEYQGIDIHYSRIIRFEGIRLPYYQAITEMFWGESVIERLYDRLLSFDATTMGVANLVERAYLRTVGIDGLREILAAGGKAEEGLIAQFDYMRMLQNNEGVTLLDKNDEFQAHSYSFGGLDNVLIQFGQQLSGASGIPLVRLFGQSPSGMSATGESDMRMYYDLIATKQESMVREGLTRILDVLYRSAYGKAPSKPINFVFNTLWQMTDEQKSTIAKSNQETINAAYTSGIIDQATALRELKQLSAKTGVFTNITDEMIEEAENEPELPSVENMELSTPEEKGALDKVRDWLKK